VYKRGRPNKRRTWVVLWSLLLRICMLHKERCARQRPQERAYSLDLPVSLTFRGLHFCPIPDLLSPLEFRSRLRSTESQSFFSSFPKFAYGDHQCSAFGDFTLTKPNLGHRGRSAQSSGKFVVAGAVLEGSGEVTLFVVYVGAQ